MAPPNDLPPVGIAAADYMMEQRIQKLEEVSVQFAAHTAAEEFRFEMISNQIRDLGEKVEGSMAELREAILELKKQHEEQQKTVGLLVTEREGRVARDKNIKKFLWAAVLAISGAFLAQFGEALWNAVTR